MTIKTISVVVFDAVEAPWLIEKAGELAASLDAHLIGAHPYNPVIYANGFGADPTIYATMQDWEAEESDKIRGLFDDCARRNGLNAEFRPQKIPHGALDYVLASVRGADLVVIGTNGLDSRSGDDKYLAENVIRLSGRPVLVLSPETTVTVPAKRIVIGWSDTREATRAAHDALPLVRSGAEIQLVAVISDASQLQSGLNSREDFAAALDRHGFSVSLLDRDATPHDKAGELLKAGRDFEAELLVTGAFGHSQVYDFVIGAVTNRLLLKSPLPLLMSK